ncbi:UDP-2-acetamido-2-deoxy-3-oxo-D-glucuronate aminotransferase [compost metagenome]
MSVYAQYTVRVLNRDSLQRQLNIFGVPTMIHYPIPLNLQPAVANFSLQLPHGDAAAQQVLSLPFHPYLPKESQQKIVKSLEAILNKDEVRL